MGDTPLESRRVRSVQTTVLGESTRLTIGRCRLRCLEGPDAGKELVSAEERVRVGTHGGCQLVLADPTASRTHFEILHTDRGYLLVDLDSTNGTFLDGHRVERVYLTPGARILAGQTLLLFATADEEVTVAPDPAGRLDGMVGQGLRMRQLFGLIRKVAPMDLPVFLEGETGTGKARFARALHTLSPRSSGPFVVVDCGALDADGVEAELFGEVAGPAGAFERARGGTLFLDAVDELRFELQGKLLRALDRREVRRTGGEELLDVDVRVVAATRHDLVRRVQEGTFRDDLFFRLSVIHFAVPPLRERLEDLPPLLEVALEEAELGPKRFTEPALAALRAYAWPGNVRELFNLAAHAAVAAPGAEIDVSHLHPRVRGAPDEASLAFNEHLAFKDAKEHLLEGFERAYLVQLLQRCDGNISRAARESGLHRKSIERLIKKYQLDVRARRAR